MGILLQWSMEYSADKKKIKKIYGVFWHVTVLWGLGQMSINPTFLALASHMSSKPPSITALCGRYVNELAS